MLPKYYLEQCSYPGIQCFRCWSLSSNVLHKMAQFWSPAFYWIREAVHQDTTYLYFCLIQGAKEIILRCTQASIYLFLKQNAEIRKFLPKNFIQFSTEYAYAEDITPICFSFIIKYRYLYLNDNFTMKIKIDF